MCALPMHTVMLRPYDRTGICKRAQVSATKAAFNTLTMQGKMTIHVDKPKLISGPKSGGASSIASSPAIHNAMLQSDPDSLKILHEIFYCDRYNEVPEGKLPYYPIRVFNAVNRKFVCCGMDPDIRSAQRLESVPRIPGHNYLAVKADAEVPGNGTIKLAFNLQRRFAREQKKLIAEFNQFNEKLWKAFYSDYQKVKQERGCR